MIYATYANDGNRIYNAAGIKAFETEEAARAWLLSSFDPAEYNHATAVIRPGEFSDAWFKFYTWDAGDENCFAPFTAEQLYIQAPGEHPGGKAWWVTPRPPVLVVAMITEHQGE